MDVLNLRLKNGINWLQPSPSNEELSTPVSKCLLVGHIVYAAERRGGSMLYILDDGTGLIDCVHWTSDYSNSTEDPYHLPSLTDDAEHNGSFSVGEPVRVFGKIECLASTSKTTENDNSSDRSVIVREIQVRIIERVEDYLMAESHHCMDSCHLGPLGLQSWLEKLGPKLRLQIQNRVNLPAANDETSSWRVFGINCSCNLPYMEDLLYCHCQCKAEPIDPCFRFRDALLSTLLSMQSKITKRLEFNYKEVRANHHLHTIALKEITSDKKMGKDEFIDKLFLKTFRALRSDGIIYLLNSNTDNYLLITRTEVLEPFVKSRTGDEITQNFISFDRSPIFLSRIHNERLLYIKRLLSGRKGEDTAKAQRG